MDQNTGMFDELVTRLRITNNLNDPVCSVRQHLIVRRSWHNHILMPILISFQNEKVQYACAVFNA